MSLNLVERTKLPLPFLMKQGNGPCSPPLSLALMEIYIAVHHLPIFHPCTHSRAVGSLEFLELELGGGALI